MAKISDLEKIAEEKNSDQGITGGGIISIITDMAPLKSALKRKIELDHSNIIGNYLTKLADVLKNTEERLSRHKYDYFKERINRMYVVLDKYVKNVDDISLNDISLMQKELRAIHSGMYTYLHSIPKAKAKKQPDYIMPGEFKVKRYFIRTRRGGIAPSNGFSSYFQRNNALNIPLSSYSKTNEEERH